MVVEIAKAILYRQRSHTYTSAFFIIYYTVCYCVGFEVCIIDAAVLLQAEWNKIVHEIWVPILSAKEVNKQAIATIIASNMFPSPIDNKKGNGERWTDRGESTAETVLTNQWYGCCAICQHSVVYSMGL